MQTENARGLDAVEVQDLKNIMSTMRHACDVVRVVDPSTFEASTLDAEGEFNEPYACFSALSHGRRCENCISMRAVREGHPVSKFEFVDGDAYFISARPIQVDGQARSLEVVQKVSDDIGMSDGLEGLFAHVQQETDQEFVDPFTGAFSRKYFDEGLSALNGRKFALVRIHGLAPEDGLAEHIILGHDQVMKRVVHEVLMITGIEDTVIRYGDETIAVQFADAESEGFTELIRTIADMVNAALMECVDEHALSGESPALFAVAVAVDEDGSYGTLAARAEELLDQAEAQPGHIVVRMADVRYQTQAKVRKARADESLHHAPDRKIVEIDALTGLSTSTVIRNRLQGIIHEDRARHGQISVIALDIVNFKQFNRMYGMTGGDLLLQFVADGIREEFPGSLAARIASDLFVVVAETPDVEHPLHRLHGKVAGYQRRINVDLKAGVRVLDASVHDAATAIDQAKIACESIKGRYDLGIRFYDAQLAHELGMNEYVVNNIDHALEEGHIKVFYQPVIRAMTGDICGFEALCRWDDPVHGLLAPGSFIAALERFHLVRKVDTHVVRQVCLHQARLLDAGEVVVPVSVNLSRIDFDRDGIFEVVESAVTESGIPRSLLHIEVTESAMGGGAKEFDAQIARFREAGYAVWIDDFGSGYSSLNVLKDYRFDTLKMDMAFLSGFEGNARSREIIVTIVDMAKKLGIRTLAEGVETREQYRFLQRIGCEMLQGFYFSKPLPYEGDAFSTFSLERPDERAYFDTLGNVNLLGLPTSGADEAESGYATVSESRSAPIALVELRGGAYCYLSTNESYLKLVEDVDVDSLDDLQEAVSGTERRIPGDLVTLLEDVRQNGGESTGEIAIAGSPYQITVRHIVTGPDAAAFIVAPVLL